MHKTQAEPIVKQKRWSDTRGIQAQQALLIPNLFLAEDSVQEEAGDFHTKEEKEHRVNAEKDKPRIQWNTERRCFLNTNASNRFLFKSTFFNNQ